MMARIDYRPMHRRNILEGVAGCLGLTAWQDAADNVQPRTVGGECPSFAKSRSLVARHNPNLLQGIYFNNKSDFRSSCLLSGAPFRSKRRPRTTALSMQILSPIGLTQPRFMTNFRFGTMLRCEGFCSDARGFCSDAKVFAQMQWFLLRCKFVCQNMCFCHQNLCCLSKSMFSQGRRPWGCCFVCA